MVSGSESACRQKSSTPRGLLRLSIGLEDPDDLWADLEQALDAAVPALAVAS